MTKFVFAKEINGGYQLTAPDVPTYFSAELPLKCSKTNRDVVLCDDAVDLIEAVNERASQLLGFLTTPFSKGLQDLNERIQVKAPADMDERIEQMAIMASLCQASLWLRQLAKKLDPGFHGYAKLMNATLDKSLLEVLADDGIINVDDEKVSEDTPQSPSESILDTLESIFGGEISRDLKTLIGSPRQPRWTPNKA